MQANLAELGIYWLKKKIFLMCRTLHTNNWPSLIDDAVMQLNSRPLKRLNGLAPKDFNSPWDDYKLQEARSNNADSSQPSTSQSRPNVSQQIQNQTNYESNKKLLQVGQYVYVDYKQKSFSKSFEPKVI